MADNTQGPVANPNLGFCSNVKKHVHDNSVIYCYLASGLCCLASFIICVIDCATAEYSGIRIAAIGIAYFAFFPGILLMFYYILLGFHLCDMSYLTQLGSYVCCVGTLTAIMGLGWEHRAIPGFTPVSWGFVVVIMCVVSQLTLAPAPPAKKKASEAE
ncbi:hypothetical protein M5689_012674 [Euphorbia peplus]|nr:hypothetical protein M5689_012674 [Euphorbia peplus]